MAIYRVDPSAAAGGDGSLSTPYNTFLSAATAASGADDQILLKRGHVYAPRNRFVGFSLAARPATRLYVSNYGDAVMPPTIDGGTWESPGASGWSYVSDGVWKKVYAATGTNVTVKRVFIGAALTGPAVNNSRGTGYSVGTPVARTPVAYNAAEATILSNINTDGTVAKRLWAHTSNPSGFLYMYTGSATIDPPTYYSGLYIVGGDGSTFGSLECIQIGDSENLEFEDLDTIGGVERGLHVVAFGSNGDMINSEFNRIRCYAGADAGIETRGLSANLSRGNQFNRCISDSLASKAEDWNYRVGSGISWLNGSQDLIKAARGCSGILFYRCEAYDGYHASFSVDTSGGTAESADGVVFDRCYGRNSNRFYGHSVTFVAAGDNCIFQRGRIQDTTQFVQSIGKGNVRSSIFESGKAPYAAYDGQGSVNALPGVSIQTGSAATALGAGDFNMESCTVRDSYGFAIQLYSNSGGSIADNAVTFKNCLFHDVTYFSGPGRRRSINGPLTPQTSILYALNASEATPVVGMQNTTLYTGSAALNVAVYLAGGAVTSSTFAGMSGASVVSEADPLVGADSVPLTGSPLILAGQHLGYRTDFDGRSTWNPPTVGAFEAFRSRSASTTRTTATTRTAASTRTAR